MAKNKKDTTHKSQEDSTENQGTDTSLENPEQSTEQSEGSTQLDDELEDLAGDIEEEDLTGQQIEERILKMLPKEKVVKVEFLKTIAGIEAGHQKQLPVSLAKRMEKKGKVKIIK
jgi:predicted ATPase